MIAHAGHQLGDVSWNKLKLKRIQWILIYINDNSWICLRLWQQFDHCTPLLYKTSVFNKHHGILGSISVLASYTMNINSIHLILKYIVNSLIVGCIVVYVHCYCEWSIKHFVNEWSIKICTIATLIVMFLTMVFTGNKFLGKWD